MMSGFLDSEKGLAHHVSWGNRFHHRRSGPGGNTKIRNTLCIFSETFLILIFMSMVIGWRKECDEYIQIIGHKDFSFKNIFGHSFVSVKTVTI